jgi:hypothetical protein
MKAIMSATTIRGVFWGSKFEPEAEIRQKGAFIEVSGGL